MVKVTCEITRSIYAPKMPLLRLVAESMRFIYKYNTFQSIYGQNSNDFIFRIHFNFENLYKGDKFLGDATNLFLNENWNDIFEEIKQSLFEACALIADNAVSNIFNKVPYKDLFLED